MDILVSFCNVKMPGRPALALLEADTLKCRILQLPQLPVEVPQWLSITGLGVSQQYVYAALQVREAHDTRHLSQLIVFDRADLRLQVEGLRADDGLRIVKDLR